MKKALAVTAPLLILGVLFFEPHATGGVLRWDDVPPTWIGGVIPYVLDEEMQERPRQNALASLEMWMKATILKFVPRTDEPDFIYLTQEPNHCIRQPNCALIGGGPNQAHGIGHALGLDHEQQRRDRDRYIRAFQEHISPNFRWVRLFFVDLRGPAARTRSSAAVTGSSVHGGARAAVAMVVRWHTSTP